MPTFDDVTKLAIIRLRLRTLKPENRNVITDDMQWLADMLFNEWSDRKVTDGCEKTGRN
jgi:chaperone required for assembly of F1-ATPase